MAAGLLLYAVHLSGKPGWEPVLMAGVTLAFLFALRGEARVTRLRPEIWSARPQPMLWAATPFGADRLCAAGRWRRWRSGLLSASSVCNGGR